MSEPNYSMFCLISKTCSPFTNGRIRFVWSHSFSRARMTIWLTLILRSNIYWIENTQLFFECSNFAIKSDTKCWQFGGTESTPVQSDTFKVFSTRLFSIFKSLTADSGAERRPFARPNIFFSNDLVLFMLDWFSCDAVESIRNSVAVKDTDVSLYV